MSEKLEIIITATDKGVSKTLKKISVDMDKVGDATEKTAKQSKKAAQSTKDLGKTFQGLSTTLLAGVGSITAAGFALKKVFDFSAEGAQMMRLEQAGKDLAASFGTSMDAIVSSVKEASFGTISDMDIIASANKAMMLGVARDAEQMASLMEVAMSRGRAMGLSTKQAFEDIVTGIGRASPMILDNLGIVLDSERVYSEYAESIGKAASELTKAEKVQALTQSTIREGNKLIEASGGLALDAAGKYELAAAKLKNYGDEFKKTLVPGVTSGLGVIFDFVDGLSKATEHTVALDKALASGAITQGQWEQLSLSHAFAFDELAEKGAILEDQLYGVSLAQSFAALSMGDYTSEMIKMSDAQLNWTQYIEGGAQANWDLAASLDPLRTKYDATTDAIENNISAVRGYDESIRAAASAGELLAGANRNIGSSISSLRKDIDWLAAGGLELQMQFEQVKSALLANAITPEEAKGLLDNLFIQSEALDIEMGEIDFSGAAQNIATELQIPLENAEQALSDFQTGADSLDIAQPFKDALEVTGEFEKLMDGTTESVQELTDVQVAAFMEGWGSAIQNDTVPALDNAITKTDDLKSSIDALQDKTITVTVNYNTTGAPPTPRQHGGPVTQDMPYLVGEVGPELFVPNQSGTIVPNNNISYGDTANVTINSYGDMNSSMDFEDMAWMVARRIQAGA